jgi:hypothetical protein
LEARGFERRDLGGVPAWGRYEDGEMVMRPDDPLIEGDPFGTRLRRGSRIAALPDAVIVSYHWPDIEAAVAAASGREPAAAAATLFEKMGEAALTLEGVDGTLLQAWAAPVTAVSVVDRLGPLLEESMHSGELPSPEDLAAAMDAAEAEPPLPPYPLVMFADLQAGREQVNAILLPYPDRVSAEAAVQTLSARLAAWNPHDAPEPLVATLGGRIETKVVDVPGLVQPIAATYLAVATEGSPGAAQAELEALAAETGGAVAVAAVRYPMPTAEDNVAPGAVLREWLRAIYRREMGLLALE